jgi:hypothetical protein
MVSIYLDVLMIKVFWLPTSGYVALFERWVGI